LAHDFTNPVVYTLDPGCNQKVYTVTVLSVNQVLICPGSSAKLIGHTPTPAGTFAWQVLQAGKWVNAPGVINGKDYQTAALANNTASSITYSFRRQVTSGAVTYDSFNNVTVQPATTITNNTVAASGSTVLCAGGSPPVINGSAPAGGTGALTYQWQTSADNVSFTDIIGAIARDYTPGTINATTYYRRKVTSGNCTTPTISNVVKITITPALKGNTIASPLTTTFCSSVDPAVITGSSPTGGNGSGTYLYQWQQSINNGATWTGIPGATSINYNPPPITVTTAFRRNVTSGICTLPVPSNTVTFIILSPPANVNVSAPSICAGNKATLTVTSPNNTLTYIWYDSPAKTKVIFTGPVFITPVLQSNQSYYVEANNGGCSSPALTKVPVTVNTLPTAPLFQKTPVTVCTGSQATISIASPNAGITYTWYTAATGGSAVFTGTDFTTPAITNAITYYVEAANSTGCVSPTRSKADIVASPLPQITVQGASVCPGSPVTLVSNNADLGVTVNWYTAQTGGSSISTGNSFTTPPVNANTTYYAEAISNTCVSATRTAALAQIILPLAAPVVQVLSEKAPDVVFQWGAVAGATGYQVSTDNGLTFTAPSTGANGTTHMVTGLSVGQTVSIIVRATGPSECQQSSNSAVATATITSPLTDEIYIANAFTPNGDGKNDVVYVHSENIKSLKFYIYSQWGELLFTSLNQQNGWDGTYKGQKEPVGVYVYYFEAIMNDGQQVNKKGTVTLLR
jgi:gliding motility-associated-like protein